MKLRLLIALLVILGIASSSGSAALPETARPEAVQSCPSRIASTAVCPVPNVAVWTDKSTVQAGEGTIVRWTTDTGWGCYVPTTVGSWTGTKGQNGSEGIVFYSPGVYRLELICSNDNPQAGYSYADLNVVAPPPPPPPPPPTTTAPAPFNFAWEPWTDCEGCFLQPADRCAVKPSKPVVGHNYTVVGVFENKCRFLPAELTATACLIRYPSNLGTTGGVMIDCAGNRNFAQYYIKTTLTHLCAYTTYTYYWRTTGYGTVLAPNGQSATSPAVRSTLLPMNCA